MKKACLVLPFYLFTFLAVSAQTFTQSLQQQKAGEGKVTITQSQEIDAVVNGQASATTQPKKKTSPTTQHPSPNTHHPSPTTQHPSPVTQQPSPNTRTAVDTLSSAQRPTRKATGYRVQVYAGGNSRENRRKAERTGSELRTLFPGEAVYVHFKSPRWICRMGNYATYEEAHQKLLEVQKLGYRAATIIKSTISLPY